MDEGNRQLFPVILSGIAELAGISAIIVGCFMFSTILGIIAGGVGLLLLGQIIDPPNLKRGD